MAVGQLGAGFGRLGAKGRGLTPPPGYVFLVDIDGSYLTDSDGYYLVEPI